MRKRDEELETSYIVIIFINIIKNIMFNLKLNFSDKISNDIDQRNPVQVRQFYLNLGYPEWDLGPRGKPKLHFTKFPTKKQAENFAKKTF